VTHDEARILLKSYGAGALDMAIATSVRTHLTSGCRECLDEVLRSPLHGVDTPKERITTSIHDAVIDTAVLELPSEVPFVTPTEHAAPTPRRLSLLAPLAGLVVLLAIASWATSQLKSRDARIADELNRLSARLVELEPMRADLSDRLATVTRELDELRERYDRERHRSVTVEEDLEPTRSPASIDAANARADVAEPAEPAWVIQYAEGTVTVRLTNVSLAEVLDEISRQSGITIRGNLAAPRAVSAEFENVPLLKAFRRLLREQNFVLAYDAQRRPRALNLLGGMGTSAPTGSTSETARESRPPAAPMAMKSTTASEQRLASHQPELPAKMSSAALPQLIDTGVRHEDRRVRADAWRAVIELLQADPELRAAGPNALGEFVSDVASDRADEALFYAATEAHKSRLRHKAAALWQQLRDRPPASADPPPAGE
jgi:hypothetical protein